MNKLILFLLILLILCFYFIKKTKLKENFYQLDEGQYLKTLNDGFKGTWGNVRGKQCKQGSWAIGARGRLSEPRNDNTGLEGLQLLCTDRSNNNSVVTVENGNKGKWQSWKKCDKNNYMCGARLRSENNKGWWGDDTGTNGLQIMCCDKTGKIAKDSKDRIRVGFDVKYHSESYIDMENTLTTPDFVVLNAQVDYKFYKQHSLSIRVNNITNESYYTNGYAVGTDRHFFVNPPFNFFATIKFKI